MPIDFRDLQYALSLKNLSDQNGTAVIEAATLNRDEFTTIIINSEFYDKKPIKIANPRPGPGDGNNRVVIQGRTTFPTAPIQMREAAQETAGAPAKDRIAMDPLEYDVVATFEIGEQGTVVVTLRYKLPDDKQFSDIFPNLPRDSDPASGKPKQQSMLDGLTLTDRYFYLTTHAHRHTDDAHDVSLQPRLNLVARWQPKGALGIFESLFQQDKLVVHGSIVFPSADWVAKLADDQFLWDAEQRIPGLNLQAALTLEARFPPPNGKLKFAVSSARIYCPLTLDWLLKNPDFGFGIAYIGQFEIPSADQTGTLAAEIRSGANDEITIAGEFPDADLEHLSQALADLVGGADLLGLMPDAIQKALGKIGLKTLVITATKVDHSYKVTRIALIIGIGAHWTVVEKLIELELSSVRFLVANPFDAKQRVIHATLMGGLQILKESHSELDFDVVVEAPEFAIYAEQKTPTTIGLKTLFKEEFPDVPSPPDIEISNISLAADRGSYYSFSMDMAADTFWTIDGAHSLPTVSVSLSNTGWRFEGWTEEKKQGIPLPDLLAKLVNEIGLFPTIELPAALKNATLDSFAVSYDKPGKDFAFTCEGHVSLIEGQDPFEITLSLDIKHPQDGSYTKHFAGRLAIPPGQGQEPLYFDLIFDSAPGATTFVAAYRDPAGRSVPIDSLIKRISADAPETGLELTIHDALFAYQKLGETSKYLFGIDIESGLNLSHLELPNLPFVSRQPLPPDQTLKLAFQVLVASKGKPFTVEEVAALNALNSGGLSLPNKEIEGVDLAVALRLGQETKQLSLPIGLDKQPKEGESGLVDANKTDVSAKADIPHSGSNAATADGTQWIKIQKSFGPVHLERIGLAYKDSEITGLLDAALAVGGLTIALDGLSVRSSLTHFDPKFDLHGLGIDYRNGPVEIGGAFLKQMMKPKAGDAYATLAGLAVIRTEKLTLSAIGSFAALNGHPSLFIYAILDYPIGGPSFFFVTGLAAGFGYNRALTMPTIDQVAAFPLVAEAQRDGVPPKLPDDQQGRQDTLTEELTKLEGYIPPTVSEHFLAVGIRFTSFKTINSFALLVVKFGGRFEIDLLGLSTLVAPLEAGQGVTPVAEAQLALKASFIPDEGFLAVQGQLTPGSYILSRKCHLTGGFAFYSWFSGELAGDFVLSLGGYHPQFQVPDHYPRVPRLGFNWQVDDHLTVKGDGYFALTGHALMAGGHLEALWHSGDLQAWFKAGADFLISWKPYQYDASLYVDMGASYTFDLFGTHTVTAELGADVHIWGPEFSGEAHVHWYIISFTVNWGLPGAPQRLPPIDWTTFKQSFLPEPDQICGVALQSGLVRQIKDGVDERWIVNAKDLVLVTNSVIPSNQATIRDQPLEVTKLYWPYGPDGKRLSPLPFSSAITRDDVQEFLHEQKVYPAENAAIADLLDKIKTLNVEHIQALLKRHRITDGEHDATPAALVEKIKEALVIRQGASDSNNLEPIGSPGVCPMGVKSDALQATQTITIRRDGESVEDHFAYTPILKAVPAALWSEPRLDGEYLRPPQVNPKSSLVKDALAGFEIRPAKPPTAGKTHDIDRRKLRYETEPVPDAYEWQAFELGDYHGQEAWAKAAATLLDTSTAASRNDLLKALGFGDSLIDFGQPVD